MAGFSLLPYSSSGTLAGRRQGFARSLGGGVVVLFFLPCVEAGGTGRHLWLREARGHPEERQPERTDTVEGAVQGRGEQEQGPSPSGDGPQEPVMSCAVLSTPPVNTQASPSACRGKRREEIPTHVPGGSNITLSRCGGHPRGHPQLLTLAQGSLVGGGSQALVALPSPQGTQIQVQSLQVAKHECSRYHASGKRV